MRPISLLTALLLATACAGGPSPEAQAAAIMAARETVGASASMLGTVAEAVVAGVEGVRLNAVVDPEDAIANVESVADGPVLELADAVESAGDAEIEGELAILDDAKQAWDQVRGVAQELLDNAQRELADLRRVLAWDARILELASTWQQSGSRTPQLELFAATAEAADELAAEIAAADPTTCPEQLERRIEAAEFVADTTRELREYILNFEGTTFDERRVELAEDPTGLGEPLARLDAGDADCWRAAAGIDSAPLLAALANLQAALNPAEL